MLRVTGIVLFAALGLALAGLTLAAALQRGLLEAGAELWPSLWFRATLLDVYAGLAVSYAWIAWKENTPLRRLAWLLAVIGTGNIGVSAYVAWQFSRLRPGEGVAQLLTRRARRAGESPAC